jgi:hypothetical protein
MQHQYKPLLQEPHCAQLALAQPLQSWPQVVYPPPD